MIATWEPWYTPSGEVICLLYVVKVHHRNDDLAYSLRWPFEIRNGRVHDYRPDYQEEKRDFMRWYCDGKYERKGVTAEVD